MRIYAQGFGNLGQHKNRGVTHTELNAGNIGTVKPRAIRQLFLADLSFLAKQANIRPDFLAHVHARQATVA